VAQRKRQRLHIESVAGELGDADRNVEATDGRQREAHRRLALVLDEMQQDWRRLAAERRLGGPPAGDVGEGERLGGPCRNADEHRHQADEHGGQPPKNTPGHRDLPEEGTSGC
jgi:hypothetical protein